MNKPPLSARSRTKRRHFFLVGDALPPLPPSCEDIAGKFASERGMNKAIVVVVILLVVHGARYVLVVAALMFIVIVVLC